MDTALPQKFLFILDRNLAKANCTGNHVCTSCDTVVLELDPCPFLLLVPSEELLNFFFFNIFTKAKICKHFGESHPLNGGEIDGC